MARARDGLRHEPIQRRVRADLGAKTVVDSTRAILVGSRAESARPTPCRPRMSAPLPVAPETNGQAAGVLHPGIPFRVHTAAGEPVSIADRMGAGFRLADEDLAGYVVLDFAAFDPGTRRTSASPATRAIRSIASTSESSRPVRIEVDGQVVAETERARVLSETSFPGASTCRARTSASSSPRARGAPTAPTRATHRSWSVDAAGRRREHLAWIYEQPLPDAVAISGLVAFWNERVDVFSTAGGGSAPAAPSPRRSATSSASKAGPSPGSESVEGSGPVLTIAAIWRAVRGVRSPEICAPAEPSMPSGASRKLM